MKYTTIIIDTKTQPALLQEQQLNCSGFTEVYTVNALILSCLTYKMASVDTLSLIMK